MDSLLPDAAELQRQRLVAQAEELRKQKARDAIDPALGARMDAFQQDLRTIAGPAIVAAVAAKTQQDQAKPQREEQEKRESRPQQTVEPIRDASARYAQALGMNYNVLDPYASLTRAATAEHAAFRADRDRLDKLISQAAEPATRKALELRKDIEKAEYVALTSDRIARQSFVITGNKAAGSESDKFTKQAEHNRERAAELRQHWGALTQPERDRVQSATPPQPAPQQNPTGPNRYAELKKTPEEIRSERIAAVADPNVRQELERTASARDAALALALEKQRQTYDQRVAELRAQKMNSANAPQLTPRGMHSPYLGETGYARATSDAKAQIQTQDHEYVKKLVGDYNGQLDKRLDAQRENQAARDRLQAPAAEPQRPPAANSPPPKTYERPANDQEAERQRAQEQQRQRQRQRGMHR